VSQLDQMALVIEGLRVPSTLQITQLRQVLTQAQSCMSLDGSVMPRDWDVVLRIVQASEQLQLALQHWKERLDERRGKEQEKGA
jgi:hypothetical protein